MNDFVAILLFIVSAVVLILAVLMPVFVFVICNHVEKMRKTLASMESMMRNGR